MAQEGQKVYSDIYDIVKDNLEKSGEKITYTEDAFISSAREDLDYVNIFDLIGYDNESFIEALYVGFFYRTIDDKGREKWKQFYDLPIDEFRTKALKELTSSREYEMNEIPLLNNIYSLEQTRTITGFDISLQSNSYMHKLYGIYYRFPNCIKNLIKRIVRKL